MPNRALVYLASARIPSRAANGVQTMSMCSAFACNGLDVTLFCRQGDDVADAFEYYGIERNFALRPMKAAKFRGTRTLRFLWDVHKAVRALPETHIYFGRDLYGLALLASTGVPIILEVHRTMTGRAVEHRVFEWLHRQVSFSRLVVVSQGMKRAYMEAFPSLDPEKILVAPGAARDPLVGEGPFLDSRQSNDFCSPIRIGYVGGVYTGRGLELLVGLAHRMSEVEVHIVGGDRDAILGLGIKNLPINIRLHGYVEPAEVGRLLKTFHVLVAPYQNRVYVDGGAETSAVMSPLKIFEYMAHGRPIICSDLPVLREILTHGDNAMLVSPDDIEGWVATLRSLISDSELRGTLSQGARSTFLERYTWRARARTVLSGIL